MMPPTLTVGMQVAAGMPVGIPAAISQQTTQTGTIIDHSNAGMMQLMGTTQHHQAQHQTHQHTQHHTPSQFHQDPLQQIVVGAQHQQSGPPNMHPQIVQQQHHLQQTFASLPHPTATAQPIPAGAPVAVSGSAPAYDQNLTTSASATTSTTIAATISRAGSSQWSSG